MKRIFAILAVAVLSMLLGASLAPLRESDASLVGTSPAALFGGDV